MTGIAGPSWKGAARPLVVLALLVLALAARVEIVSSSVRQFESGPPVPMMTYFPRFTEIALANGRPYRDFPVEYPPVSLGGIELVGGANGNETAVNLVWLMVLCDLVTVAAIAFGWGRGAAAAYLILTVPLLGFLYTTIDLLSVSLAVWGVALVLRRRERLGGVAFAAAILAKVWPLAVMPALFVQRKTRALAWSTATLAVGTIGWVSWGGPSALGQVATQRHTPGWEYESTVGSVLWALGGATVRVHDSVRVGVAPGWAKAMLLAAAVTGIATVWYRASRREPRELGFPALAAVSILMLSAPLLSPPYVIWLAPWAAVAWTERRGSVRWLLACVMVPSGVLVAAQNSALAETAVWSLKTILLFRNALIAAVPFVYLLERRVAAAEDSVPPAGVENELEMSSAPS